MKTLILLLVTLIGIQCLDITSFELVSAREVGQYCSFAQVRTSDNTLFVLTGASVLRSYDITQNDPSPITMSTVAMSAEDFVMNAAGNISIARSGFNLMPYNVVDRKNFMSFSNFTTKINSARMYFNENRQDFLYLAGATVFSYYQLDEENKYSYLPALDQAIASTSMMFKSNTLYVANGNNLTLYDASSPTSLTMGGTYTFDSNIVTMGLSADGKSVFTATSSGIIYITAASLPSSFTPMAAITTFNSTSKFMVQNFCTYSNVLAVGTYQHGVILFDITSLAAPLLLGSLYVGNVTSTQQQPVNGLACASTLLYAATGNGLQTYRIKPAVTTPSKAPDTSVFVDTTAAMATSAETTAAPVVSTATLTIVLQGNATFNQTAFINILANSLEVDPALITILSVTKTNAKRATGDTLDVKFSLTGSNSQAQLTDLATKVNSPTMNPFANAPGFAVTGMTVQVATSTSTQMATTMSQESGASFKAMCTFLFLVIAGTL